MTNISQQGRTAIIIGGSLGGLLAGNILSRRGWVVQVLERVPDELAGRGAGLVTHPELFDALAEAGVTIGDSLGVSVEERITLDQAGAVVGTRPVPQTLTAWSKMFDVLRAALPEGSYRNGAMVTEVVSLPDRAEVRLYSGEVLAADIVVAADGFRSGIRQKLLPEAELEYAGYVAWRGVVEESVLSPETWSALFEKFAFCLPPSEQILGYPVAGAGLSTAVGERRYNYVWYRATDEDQLTDLLTDEAGAFHPLGIPPYLLRGDVIADMKAAAVKNLAPQFAELVALTESPVLQPIYDLAVSKLVFGRVALLGDAAFVARPHCGMGVTKAAGDAVQLARSLASHADIDAALNEYEEARLAFGDAIVGHARHLGAYMQAQLRSPEERQMAERYRTPEAVMRDTAVPPAH